MPTIDSVISSCRTQVLRLIAPWSALAFCLLLLLPPGNAVVIAYQYDPLGHLIAATYGDDSSITYTYDPAGNRQKRETKLSGLANVQISLSQGLNLISLPFNLSPDRDSWQLAVELGKDVISLSRFNPATQTYEVTEVVDGIPQGDNFPINAKEGLFIRMAAKREVVWTGTEAPAGFNLVPGVNLLGLQQVPEGMDAYELLTAIGGETVCAGIRRYNQTTGRYESATYYQGNEVGRNFPIRRGVGYIVGMHTAVSGITLP